MATFLELYKSPEIVNSTDPAQRSRTMHFAIFGTTSKVEAENLAAAEVVTFYDGVPLTTYSLEFVGGDYWEGRANYSSGSQQGQSKEPGSSTLEFDTGGGTQRIQMARATISKNVPPLGTVVDFEGAINVNEDRIEGVDVTLPVFHFSITHQLPIEHEIPLGYVRGVFLLTGMMNAAVFKGFERGEVLFLGGSGRKRSEEAAELNFKFAASPNVTKLKIGEGANQVTVPVKLGWDVLWIKYMDVVPTNGKSIIKRPTQANVERVYEFGDFTVLGSI